MVTRDGPEGGGPPELTADECVRAGMYWFGRSDLAAAEAWWRRALYLEPNHVRAQECLRLLAKSASRPEDVRLVAPSVPPSVGMISPPASRPKSKSQISSERPSSEDIERRLFGDVDVGVVEPDVDVDAAAWALGQAVSSKSSSSTDPLEFATDIPEDTGDIIRVEAGTPVPELERTPWDEGPARTDVLTVGDVNDLGHDAVAEPTPLPELDRGRFFGRHGEYDPELVGTLDDDEPVTDRHESQRVLEEKSDPVLTPSQDMFGVPDIRIDEPIEATTSPPFGVPAMNAAALRSPDELLSQARDLFQLHDFGGAIDMLEKLVEMVPAHQEARPLLTQARSQLMRMLESKIGDLDRTPRLLISSEEVIWLNLNHRAGFILSQIDGAVTYDDIIALSGMPRLDTLRILVELISNKVIGPS